MTRTQPDTPEKEAERPGTLRRAWHHPGTGYLAGTVLLAVVLLGLYTVFLGKDPQNAPVPTAVAPAPATGAPDAQPGDCAQPAGPQTVPMTPPAGGQWELVGFLAVPSNPDAAGPGQVDPATGLRSCFARTPEGALYAAASFLGATTDARQLPAAVDTMTTGPGRQALLDQLEDDPQRVTGTGARYQLAGFRVTSYTEDVASLSLAVRGSSSAGLASVPLSLIWEDGDWRVDLPADGDVAGRAGQLPSLTGYVPWGA